jgi:hypothetical protein
MAKEPRLKWSSSLTAQQEADAAFAAFRAAAASRRERAKAEREKRKREKHQKARAKWVPYDKYIRSSWWVRRRQQALDDAGRCCEHCGLHESIVRLNVHHRNYKRLYRERRRDLVVLCVNCHGEVHLADVFGVDVASVRRWMANSGTPVE